MASTRARFTISYITLAMGAVIAFAIAVWSARQTVARDQVVAQATDVADGLIATIRDAQSGGVRLTTVDTNVFRGVTVHVTQALGNMLEPRPGYFFLVAPDGVVIYTSTLLRLLPAGEQKRLTDYGTALKPEVSALVPIAGD